MSGSPFSIPTDRSRRRQPALIVLSPKSARTYVRGCAWCDIAGLIMRLGAISLVMLALHPPAVLACAACFGSSDSPLAQGMNVGIFSLLAVVAVVLAAVAGFFIFLARQSARAKADHPPVVVGKSVTES